jgi:hypothetical protein
LFAQRKEAELTRLVGMVLSNVVGVELVGTPQFGIGV